jgi:hypothetical protein
VSSVERLVDVLLAQFPWGLHSLKLLVALLVPVAIVWVADRRLRALSETIPGSGAENPADEGRAAAMSTAR